MKILILSDSHGDVETMCGVVENEKPDMIIHLGDSIVDAEQLNNKYPDIQMIKTLGNIDSQKEDEEWIQYVEICGKRFMLTHGHTFLDAAENDTQGRQNMFRYPGTMYPNKVDIILHGHTHEPYLNCCMGGSDKEQINRWMMSPGRIGRKVNYSGTFKPIYGVLKINESGILQWQFVMV